MSNTSKLFTLILAAALLLPSAGTKADFGQTPGFGFGEENRTANLAPSGNILYPDWLTNTPEHYPFLPLVSNHDAQNQHPQQWQGQDWDPAAWNPEEWTPEIALKKFYENRTFARQYLRSKNVPVLEVGPTFYKLSDLDQRRSLKLLADYTKVFDSYQIIELRDWSNHAPVGSYTSKGMYLN